MTSTNRAANRLLLLVVGLLLLAIGGALAAFVVSSRARQVWEEATQRVQSWWASAPWLTAQPWPGVGWWLILAVLLCLVGVVVLAIFILRQGGGRSRVAYRSSSPVGQVTLDASVAQDLLGDALDEIPGVVSSRISVYRVRGQHVMRISAVCRRGASPHRIAHNVEQLVYAVDKVLGGELPVLLDISGGVRSWVARRARLSDVEQPPESRENNSPRRVTNRHLVSSHQ